MLSPPKRLAPRLRFAAWLALGTLAGAEACQANLLNPNDILISANSGSGPGSVFEYTRAGGLVQSFSATRSPSDDGVFRGLAVDGGGRIQVFNGTFSPQLATITPIDGLGRSTVQYHTLAGWSTINDTQYGGLAYNSANNSVYATDQFTYNGGEPNGIVRFDLSNNFAASRIAPGVQNGHGDYSTLALGQNGLLYAVFPPLSPAENLVDVIDPVSGRILRTITLAVPYDRGIAVDAAGNIYATSFDTSLIYRYNSSGVLTGSLNVGGTSGLHSLALSNDGLLATLDDSGKVYLASTDLTSFTSFQGVSSFAGESFITFAAPQTVPEPGSLALTACGLLGVLVAGSRVRGGGRRR